jgi:HEAT repeat protein
VSYDLGYKPQDWVQLYNVSPDAAEKARIIEEGFGNLDLNAKVSLARSERSVLLRARMIPEIPEAEFLLDMSQQRDTRLVASAASEMANVAGNRRVIDRLKELWTTSPNDEVKVAALGSLLALTSDPALADQAYKTDSYNEGIRKAALEWWAVHVPDEARDVAMAALTGDATEPVRLKAMEVLGRVKDRPGEHKAFDLLASFMSERSNSPLRAAINALAEYGDPAAIPMIEKRANHDLHFVRGDARRALDHLGARN